MEVLKSISQKKTTLWALFSGVSFAKYNRTKRGKDIFVLMNRDNVSKTKAPLTSLKF